MTSEATLIRGISPSRLENWAFCPRYDAEESSFAKGAAAEEGTKLHKAFETRDYSGLDEEQERMVRIALQFTDDLIQKMGGPESVLVASEFRLTFKLNDNTEIRGTADKILLTPVEPPKVGAVIDAKFGRVPVTEAGDNPQCIGYGLGLLDEYPELEQVYLAITQPRIEQSSFWLYTRAELEAKRPMIQSIVSNRNNPFAPPRPTAGLCENCAHKNECPAFSKTLVPVLERSLNRSGLERLISVAPQFLEPVERTHQRVLIDLIEAWAESKKAEQTECARQGLDIPGFEYRTRAGNTVVKDPLLVRTVLIASGVKPEALDSVAKYAVKDLRELTGKTQEELEALLGPALDRNAPSQFLQRNRKFRLEQLLPADNPQP